MIDVAKHELKTILDILNKHVNECEVRAFGSRVTWTNKDSSDLDLVVVCDEELERGRIRKLREAFEESSLSFTIDVMDWQSITKEFQKNIEKSYYVLKKAYEKTNNVWQYYKVSDFADVMSGGTPKTEISEYWNGNIPWITPKDLSNYNAREISRGERNISLEGLKNSSARLLPPRTVLLTSRAPVGYLAIAKNELTTNQGFKNLIVKNDFSPEFIYYLLLNNVDYLKLQASGSTFQELTASTLRNLEFLLPEYAVQEEIAIILGNIDDKIELLREQNKTLEAIAQAIYKRWFVDFEFPIEDETSKLPSLKGGEPEGRGGFDNTLQLKGYKSSGGKMVKSELGEIPEGWRIGVLNDLCEKLESGGTPPTSNEEYWNGEINWFSTKELQDNFIFESKKKITKKGLENSSAKIYPKGSVVMAIYAAPTVGHLGLLGVDSTFNQAACGFIADDKVASNEFIYSFLLHSRNVFINLSNGAAQQNLNVGLVRNFKLIISNNETMKKFNVFSKPIFLKILNNFSQIQTLSALRDSLLPKLMSGKIRVPVKNEAETTPSAEGCHPSLTGGELKSENSKTEGE